MNEYTVRITEYEPCGKGKKVEAIGEFSVELSDENYRMLNTVFAYVNEDWCSIDAYISKTGELV